MHAKQQSLDCKDKRSHFWKTNSVRDHLRKSLVQDLSTVNSFPVNKESKERMLSQAVTHCALPTAELIAAHACSNIFNMAGLRICAWQQERASHSLPYHKSLAPADVRKRVGDAPPLH